MSIENIKKRLKQKSIKDRDWINEVKYRQKNEAWLDLSFAIAVKIGSALKANKESQNVPKSQKELAASLGCSPQYVNKLLKGTENLQLETITKIEKILSIKLIEVPESSGVLLINRAEFCIQDDFEMSTTILKESIFSYNDLKDSSLFNNEYEDQQKLMAS